MKTILILSIILLTSLNAVNFQTLSLATQKNAIFEYSLGLRSKHQNVKDAFKWMHKSALKGYAPAQYEFALMFHYGAGVRQNFELAKLWFRRASQNGEPRAKTILYRFYAGEKVKLRDRKHRRYYSQNS